MSPKRREKEPEDMLAPSRDRLSEAAGEPHDGQPIVVNTAKDLKDALVPANAGQLILLRAGSYAVESSLTVPDGATLQGEGVMLIAGSPAGFVSTTVTRIVALPSIERDLLTLGSNASLRGLVIEDVPRPIRGADFASRLGNAIAIGSTEPGSWTSASIVECEIVNPNRTQAGGLDGPNGGAIAALTLNRAFGNPPAPHTGAVVKVEIRRSIVRAAGRALFAMNFAPKGRVEVELTDNFVAGTIDAIGGISRPNAVTKATTKIVSRRNLYVSTGPAGWIIGGGSSPPFTDPVPDATSSNEADVDSRDDRIDAFDTGVQAFAGRRHDPHAGWSSDNRMTLKLRRLTIHTTGTDAADLRFTAALSARAFPDAEFETGDDNTLEVDIRDSIGSHHRNLYAHVFGPKCPENFGKRNDLDFAGGPAAFEQSNRGICTPPDEFFTDCAAF